MRVIVVGAGGVARELIRRLGERWEITVVDSEEERLALVRAARSVTTVSGDGSSRVTLNRAGLVDADAVVAATASDEANLEICRLARDAGITRLVAVAASPENASRYPEVGATAVVSADTLGARRVELSLESRRIVSTSFADGRAEAIEFRIAHDAPVRGRALKDLHAQSWIVGALLREDRLIIPHGDTVLEEGDLVTVFGASSDFSELVRTFSSGEGRFPLDYGKRVALAIETEADLDGPLREAVYLVRNSRAFSLVAVHRDPETVQDDAQAQRLRSLIGQAKEIAEGVELRPRPVRGRPRRALWHLPASASIGVIVVGVPSGRGVGAMRAVNRASVVARRTGLPVLLARGSAPYRRIVTPARRTPAGRAAARAAIDLARFSKAELHSLAVVDPEFIAGPAAPSEAREAIGLLEEDASMHGMRVHSEIRRGNPVRTFAGFATENDLLVLAAGRMRPRPLPGGGIASALVRRARGSVLLVPVPLRASPPA